LLFPGAFSPKRACSRRFRSTSGGAVEPTTSSTSTGSGSSLLRPVLEYAVVHELCHLRERNHDVAFWQLIGTLLPDWERRKARLAQNERFLTLRRIEPA
jgi:hypothetical protein